MPRPEAERGFTQGVVSRQIAGLERWLGQRLFVRKGAAHGGCARSMCNVTVAPICAN